VSPRFEAFLAELYTDDDARRRFLSDPRDAARRARLADAEVEALAAIDRLGLELAAVSFALKRAQRRPRRPRWRRWLARLRPSVVP
jgi:hypothetical protein